MIRQKGIFEKELAHLEIEYCFEVDYLPEGEVYLSIEQPHRYSLKLNNKDIEKKISGYFVDPDIKKIAIRKFLRKGKNILHSSFTLTNAFLPEDIYIVGEFGVDYRNFAIIKEKKKLKAGDWCTQGYPQYNNSICYKFSCVIKKKRNASYKIELDKFEGTVAGIFVNNKSCGLIMWPPYQLDVTEHLKNGKNAITIEIVGSPKNLFGPRHHYMHYTHWSSPQTFFANDVEKLHLIPMGLYGEVRLVESE